MLAAVFFQQLHIFWNYYCNWNKTNKQTLLLHLVDEVLHHYFIGIFWRRKLRTACLCIYLFFIYSRLTTHEITAYNKNNDNWRQLPKVQKNENSKLKVHCQVWDNFLATESPLKMMKNAFNFTLNALFVLKIFKFLS